ncbi:hypothetical protein CEXT_754061 [Caerostris extrusa]|uniref:Uncharacterized protein n=1 Tax=Caerostris extrusa TaxID=172846 RepID=A0AAV4Q3W2_CAEEX|nr:hypothetical protein CEXT_754061 [Caerostris extrusa]
MVVADKGERVCKFPSFRMENFRGSLLCRDSITGASLREPSWKPLWDCLFTISKVKGLGTAAECSKNGVTVHGKVCLFTHNFRPTTFHEKRIVKRRIAKTESNLFGGSMLESIHESLLCQRADFSLQFIMLVLLVSFTPHSHCTAVKFNCCIYTTAPRLKIIRVIILNPCLRFNIQRVMVCEKVIALKGYFHGYTLIFRMRMLAHPFVYNE